MIPTREKKLWLRRRAQVATAASITIRAQLDLEVATYGDAAATGQAIASTSANGHSTSFSEPGKGLAGPGAMAALVDEMIDKHDLAIATLGIASPVLADNAAILAEMLKQLIPLRSARNDFSSLRCA